MTQPYSQRPIILVEDDPHHADLITEALQAGGLQNPLVHLDTGRAALDYFFQGAYHEQPRRRDLEDCPCLVILDIRLLDFDGLAVLKRLKQDRLYELIPVVVLSTSTNSRDLKRAYDLQANAYVTKSADYREFFEKVRATGNYWVTVNQSPIP